MFQERKVILLGTKTMGNRKDLPEVGSRNKTCSGYDLYRTKRSEVRLALKG